jgi:hypothetical protein
VQPLGRSMDELDGLTCGSRVRPTLFVTDLPFARWSRAICGVSSSSIHHVFVLACGLIRWRVSPFLDPVSRTVRVGGTDHPPLSNRPWSRVGPSVLAAVIQEILSVNTNRPSEGVRLSARHRTIRDIKSNHPSQASRFS